MGKKAKSDNQLAGRGGRASCVSIVTEQSLGTMSRFHSAPGWERAALMAIAMALRNAARHEPHSWAAN